MPAIQLTELLAELDKRHSPTQLETTLETLPVLLPYFGDEEIGTGELAVRAHWDGLDARGRVRFAAHLRRVLELSARLQERGAELPNGYHDAAFALPESRPIYLPVLDQYGLDPETATSYDIASSLSTYHESEVQVAIAAMLADLPEAAREDYLRRFREWAPGEGS